MKVMVIYHKDFGEYGHPVLKERVAPSFESLRDLVLENRIQVATPVLTPEVHALIEQIHTPEHIAEVKEAGFYYVAALSCAGVVQGAAALAEGEAEAAFAYVGAAGHHAGRSHFWGFCYLNDVAAAVLHLRKRYGLKRFLVLDVDPHFGDGTRDLLGKDPEVIHLNFYAGWDSRADEVYNNYDFGLRAADDEAFLRALDEAFSRSYEFDFMFVIFGHDSHFKDYGGFRLTDAAYPAFAAKVKQFAAGKPLLFVLSGGSRADVAKTAIRSILLVLLDSQSS